MAARHQFAQKWKVIEEMNFTIDATFLTIPER
jgi:hypothetical protein